MQILKQGKEEIIYLLTKAIEKYKAETGHNIVLNTNRKNYEVLAVLLSDISNELPNKWKEFGTDLYSVDNNINSQKYPYRKYDITGGQIKDALNGFVSTPRPFLVDACYIYLFGFGRKLFEENPIDPNLLVGLNQEFESNTTKELGPKKEEEITFSNTKPSLKQSKINTYLGLIIFLGALLSIFTIYYYSKKSSWDTIKVDMNLLPYEPTKAEIDSLEGVWLCYTGSPQARISDPTRYHKVVSNLLKISYKDGYFTFDRYGASFNHIGYMQFESPGIVSVYSRIKNNSKKTESPRHSLLNLFGNKNYVAAMSASWNFDIGEKNKIIGIREIYVKLGKGGKIEEILNDVENASCKCKVMKWTKENNIVKSYYLRNELLDSIHLPFLGQLINEKSILPNIPQDNLILTKDSIILQ